MPNVTRFLCIGLLASCMMLVSSDRASAQYPVAIAPVQPVVPAVVGYSAQRRGLFGRRVVYRPVVAPVAAAVPVAPAVTVARPVVTAGPVSVGYPPPVTSYYAPAAPVVTSYYAPAAPVVTSYYAPRARVVVPIRSYRVPIVPVYPAYGY